MEKKWLIIIVVLLVIAFASVGFFVHRDRTFSSKIPDILNPGQNIDLPKDKGGDPFAEVLVEIEKTKSLRVPLAPYEKRLSDARDLFEREGDRTKADQAAADLLNELRALPDKEKTKPKIAITFDAGAGAAPAPDLIRKLREERIKITFFATGKWTSTNPQLFKEILIPATDLSNKLGNHTVDHPHFVTGGLTDEAIQKEILDAEAIFQSLGYKAKPLFRYPYGERNQHTDDLVAALGYRVVGWTVDSLGWQGKMTASQVADRVVGKIKPNGIVLMHVGSPEDVAALPMIVSRLQPAYQFVFVDEL